MSNISDTVKKSTLWKDFSAFGGVSDVYISVGCAYVTLASAEDAERARMAMDGQSYQGEKLRVAPASHSHGGDDSRHRGRADTVFAF